VSGTWVLTLKNLLLPQFCRLCGARLLTEENNHFCPTCWEMSPRIERPYCSVCGKPHPRGVGLMASRIFPCGGCASAREERPFRRVYGAALYEGAVEEAVKLFKFHQRRNLARPLAELMAEAAIREMDREEYEFLVPVPLHAVRERDRGFNQSRLLAEELVPTFPRAKLADCLRRVRPTRTQSLINDAKERRRNVRGAFAVDERGRVRGGAVLVIDDVVTSLGTVSECAKVLRSAGATAVDVLAAALVVE